jgi:hypothetical protein
MLTAMATAVSPPRPGAVPDWLPAAAPSGRPPSGVPVISADRPVTSTSASVISGADKSPVALPGTPRSASRAMPIAEQICPGTR